ncbi:MAG: MaoC family dehydratase [Hydrocarboniphaga sp.]|uniref:MaoC family dehydratase n=1 Tax=Hydrocarboniphaga sp. TaxID=2033016 RepID=UPI0026207464|nr:MaoC family dehydratase [Hydrocarboniphaga sp.]MDB5967747.1 MaoC family dehydratase [Hydrocarboniphaga sp.]
MSKPVFTTIDEVLAGVGARLGTSDWLTVTQDRVNLFADATDDHQWIHVDAERAKDSEFGGTIAHGFLTLSLAARFALEIIDIRFRHGLNYGMDKVRFPMPVRVGSRIRGSGEIAAAERTKDGGVQVNLRITVEIEHQAKPACVIEWINRYYF